MKISNKEFTVEHGNQGRILLSQILVDDKDLSARIKSDKNLVALREHVLEQTMYTVDQNTGLRIVPNSTGFFGGSVYSFDKTAEGFYLVVFRDTDKSGDGEAHPSDRLGGVLILSLDGVTQDGISLLQAEGLLGNSEVIGSVGPEVEEEDSFNPETRSMDDGEVMSKINQLVADKMVGRPRKVSKAL